MKKQTAYGILSVFVLLYLAATFLKPPDPEAMERFGLSALQLRLLLVSIVIPIIAVWYMALYGVVHYYAYAKIVKNSPEGPGFNALALGLTILFVGLIAGTVVNLLQQPVEAFFTIVLPYIVSWLLAFSALFNLSLFYQNISGTVYKKSLKYFTLGLSAVVTLTVFLQVVSQIG